MDIPPFVKAQIEWIAGIIEKESDDWITIKTMIVKSLPNHGRRLFSLRHESTHKQVVNEFDRAVMNYWQELTGVMPIIPAHKIHPSDWDQTKKKQGWALTRAGRKTWQDKKNE